MLKIINKFTIEKCFSIITYYLTVIITLENFNYITVGNSAKILKKIWFNLTGFDVDNPVVYEHDYEIQIQVNESTGILKTLTDLGFFKIYVSFIIIIIVIMRILTLLSIFILIYEQINLLFHKKIIIHRVPRRLKIWLLRKTVNYHRYVEYGLMQINKFRILMFAAGLISCFNFYLWYNLNDNTNNLIYYNMIEWTLIYFSGTVLYIGILYPVIGLWFKEKTFKIKPKKLLYPTVHFILGLVYYIWSFLEAAHYIIEYILYFTIFI